MSHCDRLTSESRFADARRSGNTNHTSPPAHRSIQEACDRCNFELSPDQRAFGEATPLRLVGQAKKTTGQYRNIAALEVHLLGIAQQGGVLNESGGGFAEHHPTRGCRRLHPLRHPDLLTDCGVAERSRTDLTRDHLAGKEMEIGRYYEKRKFYVAAINRFKGVVKNYQTTSHVPEALHRLTECYLAVGLREEAQTSAAVLGHNFPGSPWYQASYALLEGVDLVPAEDQGSWISRALASINPF